MDRIETTLYLAAGIFLFVLTVGLLLVSYP
jgi:hypothetical protein